jgi:transcriptional regulator
MLLLGVNIMSLLANIKDLVAEKSMTIAELERHLDFSHGSIAKWDKQSPSSERLQKVADYFDVSTDYLLGRSDIPKWASNEDVIVFDQALKRNSVIMSYNGIELSEEDKLQLEGMIKAMLWEKIQENKGGN